MAMSNLRTPTIDASSLEDNVTAADGDLQQESLDSPHEAKGIAEPEETYAAPGEPEDGQEMPNGRMLRSSKPAPEMPWIYGSRN